MDSKIKEIKARNKIKRFKELINRADKKDITFEEAIMVIKDSFDIKVEYIERPFKTSDKKREYLKQYRKEQKMLKQCADEKELRNIKIQNALKKEKFFCFRCKESIIVKDISENKYFLKNKANGSKSINIVNKCPKCGQKVTVFGGKL